MPIHTRTHAHTHEQAHTHLLTHVHIHEQAYMHAHMYACGYIEKPEVKGLAQPLLYLMCILRQGLM